MKKTLLTLAAITAFSVANAQQTYNFFDPADVDADGWLWLDTQEKLDKYCGFNTKTKSFKIQFVESDYETEDFEYPAPENIADYVGLGTDGTKGGPQSHTGALMLPKASPNFVGYAAPSGHGGGILMHLPDCAKLEIYLSAEQENLNLSVQVSDDHVRATACNMIRGGEKSGGFMGDNLENVTYTGMWKDIEQLEDDEFGPNWDQYFKIQSEPGKKRTILFYNYMKNSPLYVHGIRVLTYTNPDTGAGIEGIETDNADSDAPVYNVYGVKVDKSYKGIVIKNGKKFINR